MTQLSENWQLHGIRVAITHPSKLYWPDNDLTKGDMLHYYRSMAPVMLPYFHNRPVTLRIFPRGIHDFSYYRRDLPEDAPDWLRYVDYRTETDPHVIQLPLVDDAAGLIWLANKASIEFHLWSAREPNLEEPDMVIFDLDPGEKATFSEALEAALRVHQALKDFGLRGFPKTSGVRGMHVYMPLASGYTFDAVRTWVKNVAEQLAAADPDLIAVAHGATHRGARVTIDYIQNSIGHNTAAPYTLRALAGAPVSTPLSWEEVEEGHIRPSDFTLSTVPKRVSGVGDLFLPILVEKQHLP